MRVNAGRRNSRAAKVLRSAGIATRAMVLPVGSYAGIMELTGNFHPVIATTFAPAYAMDLTFEALEPWLGFPHS